MTEQTDVVVIGAGGGGAVLGLALAQRGVKTLVLEQALGPPTGLRGEILQPNGQQILDQLGLLKELPADASKPVRYFHFCRAGSGARLCTVDYRRLPEPYNCAVVTLPNVVHHVILRALETRVPGGLRYRTVFKRLLKDGDRVVGVEAESGGRPYTIRSRVVVGADGAFSKVREALGIATKLHLYREGYVIAVLEPPDGLDDGWYYVGRRTILGIFPASADKAYAVYMIPSDSFSDLKAAGLPALRERWCRIDARLEPIAKCLADWEQTAYLPTGRVRTSTWVADGAALIGDAAHAMNPHSSQGRMQAMADAMTLAEVIASCLQRGDCSAAALAEFERRRRPHVDMLQRLADEQVLFWNTGNPAVAFLRNRVFQTLDRNRRLSYRMLATTAGFRTRAPFGWLDRVMAAGFLPDPWADAVEPVER